LGAVGVGGKVQVGEEHLAVAHVWPFAGFWFFHLHDEVGVGPHLGGGGDDGGAGGFIVGVGEPEVMHADLGRDLFLRQWPTGGEERKLALGGDVQYVQPHTHLVGQLDYA